MQYLEETSEIAATVNRWNDQSRAGAVSLCLDVCREVAKNVMMAFPQVRRWRLKRPRAGALFTGSAEDLERYAFYPLRNLQEVLGSVKDLDILEIGPGDFMTSGLSLLAGGAKSYTVIDRFIGDYGKPEAKTWYKGIRDAWPRFFPNLNWPKYLETGNFPEDYPDRIDVLTGTIEEANSPKKYDLVCSYQVGEHVNDIEAFARANVDFLTPNGVAVHRVDFGPHDCWAFYQDRLTFLRFPQWLWWLMGSNRATPNRKRYHQVYAALEKAGLRVEVIGLELFPEDMVKRARLAKRFEGMPFDSLTVGTAIFICRR
jgi:SAM-dependent methyltransferase